MKIFLSIVTLGVLALIIHKLGAKKIVHEIEDTFSSHTENNNEQAPAQNSDLATDAKTLADLENNNKDLVSRIKKLQDANKWNVKDANGFYYSVDSKGEIFSGGNSSEEYETMAKQLADYNAKKEELTKKIAAESSAADKQLAIKAIIESIKLKFSHKSSLDDDGQSADEQNDEGQNNDDDAENNYSDNTYSDGGDYGGGYGGGYGGSGGGGATPYIPPFPPLTPAQAAIISPVIAAPVTPLTTVTATPAPAPMITPFHFNPKRFFINPMHLANPVGASARFRRR
jgi:hypothetical protein